MDLRSSLSPEWTIPWSPSLPMSSYSFSHSHPHHYCSVNYYQRQQNLVNSKALFHVPIFWNSIWCDEVLFSLASVYYQDGDGGYTIVESSYTGIYDSDQFSLENETSRKKSSGEFQDRRRGKEIFNEINLIALAELFLPLHYRNG